MNDTSQRSIPFYFIIKVMVAGILFGMMFYFPDLFQDKWVSQLLKGFWAFIVPSIIISVVRFVVIKVYRARQKSTKVRSNFVLGINRLTFVLNITFLIVGLMIGFGINPLAFLTSLTIVAMAIAVTFREYITNMISGLLIMFTDQLAIEDKVLIGAHRGTVQDITLSYIVIRNEDDDLVLIPNNLIFTQAFINLSSNRSRFLTVRFELPLFTAHSMDQLETYLVKTFEIHPDVDNNLPIELKVQETGKDFIRYKLDLTTTSSSDRLQRSLTNQVLKAVLKFNNDKGIV